MCIKKVTVRAVKIGLSRQYLQEGHDYFYV